jgi:hypothetical protein
MVRQPLSGKAVANEKKYSYVVELLVVDDKLDVEVNRRDALGFCETAVVGLAT